MTSLLNLVASCGLIFPSLLCQASCQRCGGAAVERKGCDGHQRRLQQTVGPPLSFGGVSIYGFTINSYLISKCTTITYCNQCFPPPKARDPSGATLFQLLPPWIQRHLNTNQDAGCGEKGRKSTRHQLFKHQEIKCCLRWRVTVATLQDKSCFQQIDRNP